MLSLSLEIRCSSSQTGACLADAPPLRPTTSHCALRFNSTKCSSQAEATHSTKEVVLAMADFSFLIF